MSCDTTFANNTNRKLTQIIRYEYFGSLDACDLNGKICGGLEIFWCKMNEIEKMTFFGLKSTKKLNISSKIDIRWIEEIEVILCYKLILFTIKTYVQYSLGSLRSWNDFGHILLLTKIVRCLRSNSWNSTNNSGSEYENWVRLNQLDVSFATRGRIAFVAYIRSCRLRHR